MVPRSPIAWCAGSAILLGAAAFTVDPPLRPTAPGNVAIELPAVAEAAPVTVHVAAVEVPLPEPPSAVVDLGPDEEERPKLASSVFLFSSFSPIAAATLLRPTLLDDDGQGDKAEHDRAEPDRAAPGFRGIAEDEAASRDPSLSRMTVKPPPRPAFIEARVAPEAANSGLVELRPPSPDPAWTETPTAKPLWSWPFGGSQAGPESAEQAAKPERSLQSGMASWYGPGFHGRKTASGEVFNQNAMTAAHRRLPFGAKVRVIDEKTGRSVVVRINDRGPFAHGRIIDLSKASAQALGMNGIGRVKIVSAE